MTVLLTKKGYEALKKKLAALQKKRAKLVREMELARQEGDLAENFAYHQLREAVTMVTQEIEDLEAKLAQAKVVANGSAGAVSIGSRVTVEVNGQERVIEIVGDGESDPLKGKISYQTPLGKALLGKKAGDKAILETPGGQKEYRVVRVEVIS